MGFKPLYLLLRVFVNFAHLFVRLYGIVVSLWLVLVLCLAFWMGLLVVILLFVLFSLGFVYFVDIWLFGQLSWAGLSSFGDGW